MMNFNRKSLTPTQVRKSISPKIQTSRKIRKHKTKGKEKNCWSLDKYIEYHTVLLSLTLTKPTAFTANLLSMFSYAEY